MDLEQVTQVVVATDSPDMIQHLQAHAPEMSWLHVPADRAQGSGSTLSGHVWPQMLRTRMGLLDRRAVAELSIIDLLLLADADYFIGQVYVLSLLVYLCVHMRAW